MCCWYVAGRRCKEASTQYHSMAPSVWVVPFCFVRFITWGVGVATEDVDVVSLGGLQAASDTVTASVEHWVLHEPEAPTLRKHRHEQRNKRAKLSVYLMAEFAPQQDLLSLRSSSSLSTWWHALWRFVNDQGWCQVTLGCQETLSSRFECPFSDGSHILVFRWMCSRVVCVVQWSAQFNVASVLGKSTVWVVMPSV